MVEVRKMAMVKRDFIIDFARDKESYGISDEENKGGNNNGEDIGHKHK